MRQVPTAVNETTPSVSEQPVEDESRVIDTPLPEPPPLAVGV